MELMEKRTPTRGGPKLVTRESELPALTLEQLDALRRFAAFETRLVDLRRSLGDLFECDLASEHRTVETHFRVPEPGIVITRKHIAGALEQKRRGTITERDLVHWATILLMNDAYVLDPGDQDMIADWLNDISLNLDAT